MMKQMKALRILFVFEIHFIASGEYHVWDFVDFLLRLFWRVFNCVL